MSKTKDASSKPQTHFEQVPIEIVKKIIQEPPKPKTHEPPRFLHIQRGEV